MKLYLTVLFILFTISSYAKDLVVVDIDFIIKNSKNGKEIIDDLNEKNKKLIDKFQKQEKIFKDKETDLLAKKNILSQDEFNNSVNQFRNEINEFNINKQEKLNEFNKEKTNKYAELVSYINDFLVNYSKENNIKVIIDKKNILISRNDIDITKDILNIINK
jgi:outer membrane protein